MKRLILSHVSFYIFIFLYFTSNCFVIQGFELFDYHDLDNLVQDQQCYDQQAFDIFTTLKIIKKVQKNFEEDIHEFGQDHAEQQLFLHEIVAVLAETYEKIIMATVTYYISLNFPIQQNLHQTIALILIEDMTKILKIIGNQCVKFFIGSSMSWKEKSYYCCAAAAVIIIIKLGIDKIPQQEKAKQSGMICLFENNENNKIQSEKSSYLTNKFDNWK